MMTTKNESDNALKQPLLNADSLEKREDENVTPYANAGIFSVVSFSWLSPLLSLGTKKTLQIDDIPRVNSINTVFDALPVVQKQLDNVKITEYSLAKAWFWSYWVEIFWTCFLAVVHAVAGYVGPYLIDYFVKCVDNGDLKSRQGYVLAFAFCASTFIANLAEQHMIFKLQQVGYRLHTSTATMIYDKSMNLSLNSMRGKESGELVNLVAVDVDRINNFIVYLHDPWLIIFQIVLGLVLLYKNLGVVSLVALVATVFVLLSHYGFGALNLRSQTNLMRAKDDRMKVTMETLRNMKFLRFQGWEMSFLSRIFELRNNETFWLKKYMFTSAMSSFVYGVAPTFVALVTFASCLFLRVPLDAGKILSTLATFRVLQDPIDNLPEAFSILIQMKVSLGRIASFLSVDGFDSNLVVKLPYGTSDAAVEITDGYFTWGPSNSSSVTLQNINLNVRCGAKVAIVGTVGSGKSSLLSSILGEMIKISGNIMLCGTKAYVAQTAWIQSGTIRENILFGKDMDFERYDKVIEACCLKEDLKILSFGDETVIGERGINLSGGQKQRIQIARAVYHDADIFLFDDPFSALDMHTGSHVFNEVLLGLLKGKTVVYVTHQVEFLSAADVILVMKNGMIAQTGDYSTLKELICSGDSNKAELELDVKSRTPVDIVAAEKIDVILKDGNQPAQVVKEEEREKGSIGFTVYWKYLTTSYKGALVLAAVLGRVISVTLAVASNYWLAWAAPTTEGVTPVVGGSTLLIVYSSLAVGTSLFTLLVHLLVVIAAYRTATVLFTKMLQCIFRAPMSFFDATPSGRILSRCSTDQSTVETTIPSMLEGVASSVCEILGIVVVMSLVAWQVLLIFIPVLFISIWYQQYYMPTGRELSRLNGVCEAPVTQHFVETISGTTTVRSFDAQTRFRVTYMKILDTYSRHHFHLASTMKWLVLRLDAFACITFAFLLIFMVSFGNKINGGIAGLGVSYGLALSSTLTRSVWFLCRCGTRMISVERILQYTSIPSEGPLIVETNRPDSSWPSRGEIQITNLQIQYAPHMPLVLHGITCTFPGRMKTGIVGRTGSGKSTLIQALLRIIEPTSGRIMIDGIDISTIGLLDLRSRLAIIPQEPVMFQGTIRSNLDLLQQYTDEQIWETLDKCQLGKEVRKMETKLDTNVVENGENWSMGQRQLICLGRVLLKKSRVLLLDEATASVDGATDNLIQETLTENFSDCTIITIAHRMTSVLDSDLVLLLNNGRIEEFDHPTKLLENESSAFAKLVAAWSNLRQ